MPIELKTHRLESSSDITLFSLEPEEKVLRDKVLMEEYGYEDKKGRLGLSNEINTEAFNTQGLKLNINRHDGEIVMIDESERRLWAWKISEIEFKLRNLCLIFVRTLRNNGVLEFKIESAELMVGLNPECFFNLIERGEIVINLRMHLKETGVARNHGTAFRTNNWDLLRSCYEDSYRLI